jgi:hypothetical protein
MHHIRLRIHGQMSPQTRRHLNVFPRNCGLQAESKPPSSSRASAAWTAARKVELACTLLWRRLRLPSRIASYLLVIITSMLASSSWHCASACGKRSLVETRFFSCSLKKRFSYLFVTRATQYYFWGENTCREVFNDLFTFMQSRTWGKSSRTYWLH